MRRQPYQGAELQLQGTLNALEACRVNDVPHLAYASSFYVYDGIPATESVDETTPLDPLTMELFGSAKLMGEALCQEYAKTYGLTYTIFRFGPAYGPGGSSAVGDFIETGLRGETIEVWGRGQRRNQYTYVADLGDAVVTGLDHKDQTYNLISPEATSLGQLAGILHEEFGFETQFNEDRPEGPSFPYISPAKAIAELDWRSTPLRDGIRETERALALETGSPPSNAG
jgi:UDP-glucose 4-epimerase